MNVEKISSRQLAWLIIAVNISTPTMLMPMIVISYAKQNAWLSLLLATLATAAGILLNTALAGKFPGQGISQYAQTLLGSWLGKGVGLFYGISSLYIGAISAIRSFSQIFEVAVMPETPLWVFVTVLTALGIYAAWQGIEPVARANDLVLPFTLLVLLVLLLLALPRSEAYRGLPILQFDLPQIFKGMLVPLGYLGEIYFILILAPALNKPEELRSASLKALLFSALVLTLTIQVMLFVLGTYRASAYLFPLRKLAVELLILGFFEHFEPLLLSAWLTVTTIKFAVFIYCFALATSQVLGRHYRPLLLVGIIPVLAIALGPISLAEQMRIWIVSFLFNLIVPLTFFILPGLLLCIAKVRKRYV